MTQQNERIIGVRPNFDARHPDDRQLEKALDEKREEARRWLNTTGRGRQLPVQAERASTVDTDAPPLSVVSRRD